MIEWGELQNDPDAREALFASQPELRAEYEGYIAFQRELRSAALEQPVPFDRLDQFLSSIASPPVNRFERWIGQWGPRMAVAGVIGSLLFIGVAITGRDPVRMDTTSQYSELRTNSPEQAAHHVRASLNIQAPIIPFATYKAEFQGVRTGGDWAAYEYTVSGKPFTLTISKEDHFDRALPLTPCDGENYYEGKTGCGWRQNNLAFYLQGDALPKLQEMALTIAKEIDADETCK